MKNQQAKCRLCFSTRLRTFLDLRNAPPSNNFLDPEFVHKTAEPYLPLRAYVCEECLLVQLEGITASEDIFNAGYVYFSSYSSEFLRHAEHFVDFAVGQFGLDEGSSVYEAASNDGYLLQYFCKKGIPCCGIEPSKSVADVATEKGVETVNDFFTASTASQLASTRGQADLFVANNVLAHVPDLNDFIAGIKVLLKAQGTATLEFPHLMELIKHTQFDTIYHEHYSYFSIRTLEVAFKRHGLEIYQVEQIPTHGGSLRIFVSPQEAEMEHSSSVNAILELEKKAGMDSVEGYEGMQSKVDALSLEFLLFLADSKRNGAKIAAYGAAAKGNTLLNYCGVNGLLIDFVADITPAKQGKCLPGSHIPVFGEEVIQERKPDYIVILPWNWKDTIEKRLSYVRDWGAKFVTVIPELRIW